MRKDGKVTLSLDVADCFVPRHSLLGSVLDGVCTELACSNEVSEVRTLADGQPPSPRLLVAVSSMDEDFQYFLK
eukprot:3173299-Amphidinium_carterae.1